MKRSTGLRNGLLTSGSFKSLIDGKVINIYSGAAPASADDAIGAAVLLCTISVDGSGTGVTLATPASGGQVTKNPAEVWSGTILSSGTASFFRIQTAADDGSASATAVRLQGNIGLDGADLNFATLSLVTGNVRQINYFVASISAE